MFSPLIIIDTRGSRPVVREGLPGGTQVTSIFPQKPGLTTF